MIPLDTKDFSSLGIRQRIILFSSPTLAFPGWGGGGSKDALSLKYLRRVSSVG